LEQIELEPLAEVNFGHELEKEMKATTSNRDDGRSTNKDDIVISPKTSLEPTSGIKRKFKEIMFEELFKIL